jgi:anti-sigma factor RsiW
MTLTPTLLAQHLLGILDPETAEAVEAQLASDPDAQATLDALRDEAESYTPRRGRKPELSVALARALRCPGGHAEAGQPCEMRRGRAWLCGSRLALVGVKATSGTSGAARARSALAPGVAVIVQTDLMDLPGRIVEQAGRGRWRVIVGDQTVEVPTRRIKNR